MLKEEVIRRAVLNPAVKCNFPKVVYNPYLKMKMLVPCRRCSSCLDLRSSKLSLRVDDECKQHKYSIFFTLTYDNEHLPLMQAVKFATSPYSSSMCSLESNRYYDNVGSRLKIDYPLDSYDFGYLRPRNLPGSDYCFGYVNKKDIVDFLKRLRINIFRKVFNKNKLLYNENGKIRYFISSEYGPATYRPHYHGIIWTDTDAVAKSLVGTERYRLGQKDYSDSLIYESWKMCDSTKVDVSFVAGQASSYVASYTNGFCDLPKVLQLEPLRPFVMASKNPIIGSYKENETSLCKCLSLGTCKTDRFTEEFASGVLPLDVVRKYFGLPKRCYQYDFNHFVLLYEKYEQGRYVKVKKSNDKFVPMGAYLAGNYYNVADYYFCRKLKRFMSRPHVMYSDDSGRLVPYACKFEKYDFLYKVFNLLQSYKRYANELFYSTVNSKGVMDCAWLQNYPNLLIALPSHVSSYSEFNDLFGLDDVAFSYLYNLSDNGYQLDKEFVRQLMTANVESFKLHHALHIKHTNSTKIFNDYVVNIFNN